MLRRDEVIALGGFWGPFKLVTIDVSGGLARDSSLDTTHPCPGSKRVLHLDFPRRSPQLVVGALVPVISQSFLAAA